jgi:hypothetical protein
MDARADPLADIVPLARLPDLYPHLATKDRCDYWLRMRTINGAEAAGAIWTKDGVAFCSLSKLATWLVSPSRARARSRPGDARMGRK